MFKRIKNIIQKVKDVWDYSAEGQFGALNDFDKIYWFGPRWLSLICLLNKRVEVPVGKNCWGECGKPIKRRARGVIVTYQNGAAETDKAYYCLDCYTRQLKNN